MEAGLKPVDSMLPIPPKVRAARRWLVGVGVIVVCWALTALAISHTEQAPSYALVAQDNATKTYLSPACAFGRGPSPITTLEMARDAGFKPDPVCEMSGGFLGASQSVMEEELAFVHLYPKRGTRWRPDGSWKW